MVFIVPNQANFRVILGCLHSTLQCTMVDLHGQALKSGGFHPLLNITVLVSFILVTVVGSVIFSVLHIGNWSKERDKRTFQRWYKTSAVECSFPNPNRFSQRPTLFLGSSYPGTVSMSAAQQRQHCLNHAWMFTLLREVLQSSEMIGAPALSYGELTVLSW